MTNDSHLPQECDHYAQIVMSTDHFPEAGSATVCSVCLQIIVRHENGDGCLMINPYFSWISNLGSIRAENAWCAREGGAMDKRDIDDAVRGSQE